MHMKCLGNIQLGFYHKQPHDKWVKTGDIKHAYRVKTILYIWWIWKYIVFGTVVSSRIILKNIHLRVNSKVRNHMADLKASMNRQKVSFRYVGLWGTGIPLELYPYLPATKIGQRMEWDTYQQFLSFEGSNRNKDSPRNRSIILGGG